MSVDIFKPLINAPPPLHHKYPIKSLNLMPSTVKCSPLLVGPPCSPEVRHLPAGGGAGLWLRLHRGTVGEGAGGLRGFGDVDWEGAWVGRGYPGTVGDRGLGDTFKLYGDHNLDTTLLRGKGADYPRVWSADCGSYVQGLILLLWKLIFSDLCTYIVSQISPVFSCMSIYQFYKVILV